MPLIQDIFKTYGNIYLQKYGDLMPANHKKALRAIMNCRTAELGGEVYLCKRCQQYHFSYHSCRNRHCVVCQNEDAGLWIENQKMVMLPFTYFLATFTLPDAIRKLARKHQKLFYNILFKASAQAIKLLAKDEKYLGAHIGFIGILHTWTRALVFHPHIHYLIPGGGISNDGKSVRFSDEEFLLHVKPLSIIFKAKFRDALKKKNPQLFRAIPSHTWKEPWVVHIKPVGNGEKALEYMGRYLFRVAISGNRILKLENDMVTFRYTDSKTGKNKIVTLKVLEFIRRFLQHVLPHNFMKVRYFGFLAAAAKKKLYQLRKMLFMNAITKKKSQQPKPVKEMLCPNCGTPLTWVESLPKGCIPRAP